MQTIRHSRALARFAETLARVTPNTAGLFWLPYLAAVALLAWVLA
jgi:hypothetical protein